MKRSTFNAIVREKQQEAAYHKVMCAEAQKTPEAIARKEAEKAAANAKVLQHAEMIKNAYLGKGATEQEAEERKQIFIKQNTK